MIDGLQNFFAKVAAPNNTNAAAPVQKTQIYSNPFANPFLSRNLEQMNRRNEQYGKNNPFPGGYFAGYYNNKPNIVGRKLFVEV
ncbi:MAG: hypothetical protein ACI37T_07040 [Candidatus Gastranaerophilaceae bacterium]